MVLIKPKFGAVELCLEESNSLLELFVRSVYYEVASPGLHSTSELGCFLGRSAGVNVPIVKIVPSLVRTRISISLGASILEVAYRMDSIAGHLRWFASEPGRGFLNQDVGRVNCSILELSQAEEGAIVGGSQSSHKIASALNSPKAVIPLSGPRSALVESCCHD